MKTIIKLFILAILVPICAVGAPADQIAVAVMQEQGWTPLPMNENPSLADFSQVDLSDLIKRKVYVANERLAGTFDKNGNPEELVLQKNRQFSQMDSLNFAGPGVHAQSLPELIVLKRARLPTMGDTYWMRPATEKERVERKLAFGNDAERIDNVALALQLSGAITAQWAGALDEQLRFADPFQLSKDLNSASLRGGDMCEHLIHTIKKNCAWDKCDEEHFDDYSNSWAPGIDPSSGKFSFAAFMTGPACMFTTFGNYLASLPEDDDRKKSGINRLQEILDEYGPENSGLLFEGLYGPENDPAAVISVPLQDPQPAAALGGGSPFLLLAGSAVAMSAAASTSQFIPLDDGSMARFDTLTTAIDLDAYVVTLFRICGVRQFEGKSQDFCMEREMSDFRTIPGTALYEPYREEFRVSGIFSDAEREKMAEAEAQLAEYERQLASMPKSQRAMMERMVGPQIEQYRNMANGGAVSFEVVTTGVTLNPQLGNPDNSIEAVTEKDSRERLVRRIQQDLETLGYEPGVLNGDLTQQTVTAIVRFEGDHGMPVTGEPSQQLADALALAVNGGNQARP